MAACVEHVFEGFWSGVKILKEARGINPEWIILLTSLWLKIKGLLIFAVVYSSMFFQNIVVLVEIKLATLNSIYL